MVAFIKKPTIYNLFKKFFFLNFKKKIIIGSPKIKILKYIIFEKKLGI